MWLYLCEDASFYAVNRAFANRRKMLKCCPERDCALRVPVFFGLIRPDGDAQEDETAFVGFGVEHDGKAVDALFPEGGNCFAKGVDAACLDDREIHFRPPVFRIVS